MESLVDKTLRLMEQYMSRKAEVIAGNSDGLSAADRYQENRAASLLRDYSHYKHAGGSKMLAEILDEAQGDW